MFIQNRNQYYQRFHWTPIGNIGKINSICMQKMFRVYCYMYNWYHCHLIAQTVYYKLTPMVKLCFGFIHIGTDWWLKSFPETWYTSKHCKMQVTWKIKIKKLRNYFSFIEMTFTLQFKIYFNESDVIVMNVNK